MYLPSAAINIVACFMATRSSLDTEYGDLLRNHPESDESAQQKQLSHSK